MRKTVKPSNPDEIFAICQRIKFYREKKGIEQKQLAAILDIHPNAISNWENGRSRPDMSFLPAICEALDISLLDLFDIPAPVTSEPQAVTTKLSADDEALLTNYHMLSKGHQSSIITMIDKLKEVEEDELYYSITEETKFSKELAAGFDPGCEFDDKGETVYLYKNMVNPRMDCIFRVNGDSMEPDFHNGDHVMVQRLTQQAELNPGEIGAFIFGNETYIKQYQKSGLRSLNKKYKVMKFTEDDSVYIIGRVLGILPEEAFVSFEDSQRYERAKKRIEG